MKSNWDLRDQNILKVEGNKRVGLAFRMSSRKPIKLIFKYFYHIT